MFGHHLELAAHASESAGGFGNSHGKKFGFAFGGPSFGNSSHYCTNLNSGLLGQNHRHLAGNYGFHDSYLMPKSSLLAELTKTKSERRKNHWARSSFSYPYGRKDVSVLGLSYEKQEERQRPKLQKRMSMVPQTQDDDREDEAMTFLKKRTGAPSFASDPLSMRRKTIDTSSMPNQCLGNVRISRSMSINEEHTQPANMDIALPILRRQRLYDAEKAKRKRVQRKSFPFSFGKDGRSSKTKSDTNSGFGEHSDTSSVQLPPRSRGNTHEYTDSSILQPNISSKSFDNKMYDEKAHEQLIVSLMNTDLKDKVFDYFEDTSQSYSYISPQKYEHISAPSERSDQMRSPNLNKNINPTSPVRQTPIDNNKKRRSHSLPQAIALTEIPQSPKRPRDGAPLMNNRNLNPDPNDSDQSTDTIYYDCTSQHNSPKNGRLKQSAPIESLPRSKEETGCDTSISTDGEDTTSTCYTPPRKMCQNSRSIYQPDIDFANESTHKPYGNYLEVYPNKNTTNETVNSKKVENPKSTPFNIPRDSFPVSATQTAEIDIHDPILSRTIQNENERVYKHASYESSESGYATSLHRLSHQEDDRLKVSQYVCSLPSNPDIAERYSENDTGVKGSLLDSDSDEPNALVTKPTQLEIIHCVSGSESEDNFNTSDSDVSVSQLEVMKILDSPKHVRERVADICKKIKHNPNYTGVLSSSHEVYRNAHSPSFDQIMEINIEPKFYQNDLPDGIKQQPKENLRQHSDVNSIRSNVLESPRSDKNSKAQKEDRQSSKPEEMFDRFNSFYGRPYESSSEKKTRSCINVLLNLLNMILLFASMAIIGICLWLILTGCNVNDVTSMLGDNLLQVIVYITLSAAGVGFLVSFCLCCSVRENTNGLGFYASALVLATIAFGTSCILTAVFADKLSGIEYRFNFKDKLLTSYGLTTDIETKILTDAWDAMQTEFQCCGAEGHENDTDSWALYSKTAWLQKNPDRGLIFVPESCCRKNSNTQICQGSDNKHLGPPRWPYSKAFPYINPALNTDGCYPFLLSYLQTLSKLAALTTGCLAGLYSLTAMLTWIFCFKKRKDQMYDCNSHDENELYVENNEESLRLVIRESEHYLHHEKPDADETKRFGLPSRVPEKSIIKSASDYSKPIHREHADHAKNEKKAYFEDLKESKMNECYGSEQNSQKT
ncbi:hypothetical protein DPMN_102646 [Dreissena polymorpha]|uniref:Tetraspanin n=1 Tax=Dreissena polymorpha TaxID=45954 RepID=A0A9D4LKR3_DREPO|nr:hypothetical protein DPMN_102646 [Dreissena polymorpha]